jgi:DNA-binding GntR family transcriptional regulator
MELIVWSTILKTSFVPVREHLGQQVYQHLLEKIYKMEIAPGARLGVGEIADQLGVSRSPVRDAFRMLMSEGMVELLPSGRYRVIQFNRKYVDDVFVLRRTLELTAVRLSVQHLDRERIQALHTTWEQFKVADEADPHLVEDHLSADQDLHQSIAVMSQNLLLRDALDKIIPLAGLIRRWQYSGGIPYSMLVLTAEEHLTVLDAMLARDAEGAVWTLDEHLTRAYARILERLDSDV